MKPLRVLFITSADEHCGIREYGEMLQEEMKKFAPIEFEVMGPSPGETNLLGFDLIHVNHHAALHAEWTPFRVAAIQAQKIPVVVTQHDTYETFAIMQERGFSDFRGADALVIHEPVEGLMGLPNVHYIRQGIPISGLPISRPVHLDRPLPFTPRSKTLGTAGFPFPWKGHDVVARASREAGWGCLLIAPNATVEQCEEWQRLNPAAEIIPQWLPRREVIARLKSCDATAWPYTSANSGTSGAIRMGFAAGQPLAFYPTRQFRDLMALGIFDQLIVNDERELVDWLGDLESRRTRDFLAGLVCGQIGRDTWARQITLYHGVYQKVLGKELPIYA